MNLLQSVVTGQFPGNPTNFLLDLGFGHRSGPGRLGLGLDHGMDFLGQAFGNTHHSDFSHPGNVAINRFQVNGVHILSGTSDDYIFDSTGDIDVAVDVHPPPVTGVEPVILHDCPSGTVVPEVPGH